MSLEKGLDKHALLKGGHDHEHEGEDHDHDHEGHKEDHDHGHDHDATKEEHDHDGEKEAHDHGHDHDANKEDHDHDHEGEEAHHHHGMYDPHVWLDPVLNQTFAKEIKDALVKKDPDHKAEYEKNYEKLVKDLKDIDASLKDVTKDKKDGVVYISHESIGYLAKRYGFEQEGIQNMNAEDPSQKTLTKIVKEINDHDVKYILYEDNVATKVTDTIRKETKAEPLTFYNMESLNKEQEKDKKLTYQKLMEENIDNLGKALNGK